MQLIYRANVYHCTLVDPQTYTKPRTLNWRFHAPGESYEAGVSPQPYVRPNALNWRFQTREMM